MGAAAAIDARTLPAMTWNPKRHPLRWAALLAALLALAPAEAREPCHQRADPAAPGAHAPARRPGPMGCCQSIGALPAALARCDCRADSGPSPASDSPARPASAEPRLACAAFVEATLPWVSYCARSLRLLR